MGPSLSISDNLAGPVNYLKHVKLADPFTLASTTLACPVDDICPRSRQAPDGLFVHIPFACTQADCRQVLKPVPVFRIEHMKGSGPS